MIYLVGVLLDSEHACGLPINERKSMEVIYAVEAPEEMDAKKVAFEFAAEYEASYVASDGDDVSWRRNGFSGVWRSGVEIAGSGEVFGRILRRTEADSFRSDFED